MKKLLLFCALLLLNWGLNAQNTDLPDQETLQVTPDTLHLYFYGCSPHLALVTVINPTDELVVINRVYAEHFRVDFLLEGVNIAETGTLLFPNDTLYFEVYASPYYGKDRYGEMIIDTDLGDFRIVLFYEDNVSVGETEQQVTLYPNPANELITVRGEKLGIVSVFNALGQKVDEFFTDEKQLIIPTSNYPNGVYFIRAVGIQEKRFIVSH